MGHLQFEPLIPSSLWLALALAGAGLLAAYALHRPGAMPRGRWGLVVGLMAGSLALVLGILLNPTWTRQVEPPPGKPVLTVLVDASASMATPDAAGGTRYAAAGAAAQRLAERMGREWDVRVRTFAGQIVPVDPIELTARQPEGEATDVGTAIAASLDQQRPQGQAVVLLSDGIHNAGGGSAGVAPVLDAVRLARASATPIYTRTFGGEVKGWDVAVEVRSAQDLAVVGQKVPVTVRLSHHGLGTGKTSVVLTREGQEVARREAQLLAGAAADVHFLIGQDKPGVYPYEVRAEPLAGESSEANNSAAYVLRVVDEPIRVLVLEGKPYWDSKFFLRTLGTDPAVALDSVVRLTDDRLMRRTLSRESPAAPATTAEAAAPAFGRAEGGRGAVASKRETWQIIHDPAQVLADRQALLAYQVLVLGRDAEVFLTDAAMDNLQHWIARDGGALVCYRGAPTAQVNQRLARLLPVRWTPQREGRFRVRLTDEGRDAQWLAGAGPGGGEILSRLPTLASAARVDSAKPLAVVLATGEIAGTGGGHDERAAVVYQPYGSGRVVVVEGAGMWRWAFLPPQFQEHEKVYATLWPSLLRWLTSGGGLMPGQQMTLRADKVRFGTTEPATATLLVRTEAAPGALPAVELLAGGAPDAEAAAFVPSASGEEPGVYRVNFGMLAEGRYRARIAGASADDASAAVVFDVRNFGQERLDLQARPDLMNRIAADSEGAVLTADVRAGDFGAEIQAHFREHLARSRPTRVERTTAWDRWWALAGVIGLWGTSWAIRRGGGLV